MSRQQLSNFGIFRYTEDSDSFLLSFLPFQHYDENEERSSQSSIVPAIHDITMGSRRPPSFYQNMLGPPDPIDYLRGVPLGSSTATASTAAGASRASSSNDLRRLDSDDEGIGAIGPPPYCSISAGCGPTNVVVATTNGLLTGDFDVDHTDADHVDQSAGAASSVGHHVTTALFRNSSVTVASAAATSSPP